MTAVDLMTTEDGGVLFLEGPAARSLMRTPIDATQIVEACFTARTRAVLLYSSNLTARFFDVSSLEAGDILQKLKQYGVHLAVIREPASPRPSRRFPELLEAERRDGFFNVFDARQTAIEWLSAVAGTVPRGAGH